MEASTSTSLASPVAFKPTSTSRESPSSKSVTSVTKSPLSLKSTSLPLTSMLFTSTGIGEAEALATKKKLSTTNANTLKILFIILFSPHVLVEFYRLIIDFKTDFLFKSIFLYKPFARFSILK